MHLKFLKMYALLLWKPIVKYYTYMQSEQNLEIPILLKEFKELIVNCLFRWIRKYVTAQLRIRKLFITSATFNFSVIGTANCNNDFETYKQEGFLWLHKSDK